MKIQIIDGEVTEVTQQDWQAFAAWRQEQAKGWPQSNDRYWYITGGGDVDDATFNNRIVDEAYIAIGNIYRTEAEALAQVEKLKAKARIDKYIADNGLAFVPDWGNAAQMKWETYYNHVFTGFRVQCCYEFQYSGGHYYATDEHAQQVIDNCTDDLKTLFGVK